MKTKGQLALFASLLLMIGGTALAQDGQEFEFNNDSQEIEGVSSYSLVISALPAEAEVEDSETGEVEAEKEFEREPDEDTNFSITREEALAQAREELGSDEWNLESTDIDDEGLYEFSFIRGESEAEVTVDASSGEVIALEGEIEYEPEERREEPVISLSGYMVFNTGGYEVDVESEEENNNVDFTVTIDEPEGAVTQALTRVPVEETEDVEGGTSNVSLEVIMGNETVLERNRQFEVQATETDEESSETEDDSEETEREETERKQLEEMSREELVNQVRELRERVRDLESRLGDETPTDEETQRDNETEGETEDEETEEQEDEQETDEGSPEETPGQGSERRPGFVNRLLSGLFG